ncbi:hypothetical protein QA599_19025 [Haloarculaceae archaeon H-GB1-1]|nr:hypothetical protein [Haloarculaceae archaeon H-GB1-1]
MSLMPSFLQRLEDGWHVAVRHLPLAVIPLVVALFDTDKIRAIAAFDGTQFGFRLGLPTEIVDVWQFVSVPNDGVHVELGTPGVEPPLAFALVPVWVAVKAGLMAGYFGSIRDVLGLGTYDFAANVRSYVVPFAVYLLAPYVVLVPVAAVVLRGGTSAMVPLVIVLLLVFTVLAYLLWATPYLVVLRDTGLLAAAKRSYALATGDARYVRFSLYFAVLVLVTSAVATGVVVNLGLAGVVIGVVGFAPFGLACNVMAMRFVADVDPQSPSFDPFEVAESPG